MGDALELPLLPLRKGELEARLAEMDTTQVRFMIPRIALVGPSRDQDEDSDIRAATPNISEDGLDSEDLDMVRPNAEVIREIREIKKLQFRCGVAIVLVMIVGVLVLACGIGFIIFHAAKLNSQIDTGVQKIGEANRLLQEVATPLLQHTRETLDEGIDHIDKLVNTHLTTLMRVLNGDEGVEVDPNGVANVGAANLAQKVIGGCKIGMAVSNHKNRANDPDKAASVTQSTSDVTGGCCNAGIQTLKGIGNTICCKSGAKSDET